MAEAMIAERTKRATFSPGSVLVKARIKPRATVGIKKVRRATGLPAGVKTKVLES